MCRINICTLFCYFVLGFYTVSCINHDVPLYMGHKEVVNMVKYYYATFDSNNIDDVGHIMDNLNGMYMGSNTYRVNNKWLELSSPIVGNVTYNMRLKLLLAKHKKYNLSMENFYEYSKELSEPILTHILNADPAIYDLERFSIHNLPCIGPTYNEMGKILTVLLSSVYGTWKNKQANSEKHYGLLYRVRDLDIKRVQDKLPTILDFCLYIYTTVIENHMKRISCTKFEMNEIRRDQTKLKIIIKRYENQANFIRKDCYNWAQNLYNLGISPVYINSLLTNIKEYVICNNATLYQVVRRFNIKYVNKLRLDYLQNDSVWKNTLMPIPAPMTSTCNETSLRYSPEFISGFTEYIEYLLSKVPNFINNDTYECVSDSIVEYKRSKFIKCFKPTKEVINTLIDYIFVCVPPVFNKKYGDKDTATARKLYEMLWPYNLTKISSSV